MPFVRRSCGCCSLGVESAKDEEGCGGLISRAPPAGSVTVWIQGMELDTCGSADHSGAARKATRGEKEAAARRFGWCGSSRGIGPDDMHRSNPG
jgi:hypothetical protein